MVVNEKEVHNLYIGTTFGLLKGVKVCHDAVTSDNLHTNLSALDSQSEISRLAWGDTAGHNVLLGLRRRAVKVYDTSRSVFTMCRELQAGSGALVGLGFCHGAVLTAVESGAVTLWKYEAGDRVHIDTMTAAGGPTPAGTGDRGTGDRALCCLRQHPHTPHVLLCGGREVDLQMWDLTRPDLPVFAAKNVRPDKLDLRVPVWVTDAVFLSDQRCVAACHKHSFVRVYDTASSQRRPVFSITGDGDDCQPFTCMSTTNHERQVVVGSGRGRLDVYDLRMCGEQKQKSGGLVHTLKGMAGGVRDLVAHPTQPLVVSVSLDRFLRVHRLDNRQLLHKVYLKAQLNCVLMRDSFDLHRPSTLPCEVKTADDLSSTDPVVTQCDEVENTELPDSDDDVEVIEESLQELQAPSTRSVKERPLVTKDARKEKKVNKLKKRVSDSAVSPSTITKKRLPKLLVNKRDSRALEKENRKMKKSAKRSVSVCTLSEKNKEMKKSAKRSLSECTLSEKNKKITKSVRVNSVERTAVPLKPKLPKLISTKKKRKV